MAQGPTSDVDHSAAIFPVLHTGEKAIVVAKLLLQHADQPTHPARAGSIKRISCSSR